MFGGSNSPYLLYGREAQKTCIAATTIITFGELNLIVVYKESAITPCACACTARGKAYICCPVTTKIARAARLYCIKILDCALHFLPHTYNNTGNFKMQLILVFVL